jgi:NYN domain/OST-HTH/LOTUS domain
MPDSTGGKLALLIDADNVPPKSIASVMIREGEIGRFVVRRVYGNLTSLSKVSWRNVAHEFALSPVLAIAASGSKNAADMRLAIDAMDLLHDRDLDGVCIVSSDSDFAALAIRIRENGLSVYGFGESKTPAPYVSACNVFYKLGEAPRTQAPEKAAKTAATKSASPRRPRTPAAPRAPEQTPAGSRDHSPGRDAILPRDEILSALDEAARPDGWAPLSSVRQKLGKRMPGFNLRNYKHAKFRDLVAAVDGIETRESQSASGPVISVRRQPGAG